MAEEQDQSQKTEDPTTKRVEDARGKGDVATSREVQNWFMLAAATVIVGIIGPGMASSIARLLRTFLAAPHEIDVDPTALGQLVFPLVAGLGVILLLPALILVVAAVAPPLLQHGLLFATERLKPELSKISPLSGLKRLFSMKSLAELIKGLLKISIIAVVAAALVAPSISLLPMVPSLPLEESVGLIHTLAVKVLGGVVAVLTVIAGLDFAYQRFEHGKKLRMSRQEVRDELKQSEGDPHVKARLRAIRNERARQRMMQAVPEADVVITNPTHYAVALVYDQQAMAAPRMVAKGIDAVALRIRQVAHDNDVPVVENPPLARALSAGVKIGEEIPTEHYETVARIIAYVLQLKANPLPSGARASKT